MYSHDVMQQIKLDKSSRSCGIWLEFSRFSIDVQLMHHYTTRDVHRYLWLQKECTGNCAANLLLHAQNFASAAEKNVVSKFTNRLK